MITKQTTKRAAKILAERKEKYAREFERAKGDSKAIARAAAEYRSEYGKTPLKRWHNALSQAAKETASHAAPKRKPAKPETKTAAAPKLTPARNPSGAVAPKYKVPFYIILTHHYKNVPFERQAPYVECFNEVEKVDGHYVYKACTYGTRLGKMTKHVHTTMKEADLSKDLVGNVYIMLSKFESDSRSAANMKYWAEEKRRSQEERIATAEKRKAEEKEEKERFKAAHKLNPDWIKDFAKQTGVSQAVIKALYAICDNPSRKEDLQLRPILGGIYCDPDGHIVATDAYILVSVQANIPKSMAGNIYLKSGQKQTGKYPNYKAVLAHYAFLPNGKHRVRPYIECKGGRPATTQTDWKGNKYFEAFGGHWREDQYRLILNVFEAIGESPKGYHIDAEKEAKYKIAHEEFYKDVEFNSIKAKLLATNPMSYVSKRVQAIQTPTA